MIRAGITFAALLLAGTSVCTVAADNVNGRNWAATCTGCHGTNGHSEGGMPLLAGLDKAYIVNAMKEFKAGTRAATVMHQHAKGYSDEQIERIAEFFAAQPLR
ncbi:MAG TPA: c-type cytochrome [Burkholderiales bacterium]|jgi:cytochrome c553|nr:c-type cytochrome [Burkholderiales bacterium]